MKPAAGNVTAADMATDRRESYASFGVLKSQINHKVSFWLEPNSVIAQVLKASSVAGWSVPHLAAAMIPQMSTG